MRILLIADIHGNWPALQAITEPHDVCIFLGDLVDYGLEPAPCIDWVRKRARYAIRGNHDHDTAQNVTAGGSTDVPPPTSTPTTSTEPPAATSTPQAGTRVPPCHKPPASTKRDGPSKAVPSGKKTGRQAAPPAGKGRRSDGPGSLAEIDAFLRRQGYRR
jgi:predicted phosphodiesterase